MFTIDYILFVFFTLIGSCLLFGMNRKEKVWIGGIGGVIAIVFIIVSQIIKLSSGFFESRNEGASVIVGDWVVPCYMVLGLYLLGMINYRWIKAALKKESWVKFGLISLDILFSLVYLWVGGFALFIVAFTYYPFAP